MTRQEVLRWMDRLLKEHAACREPWEGELPHADRVMVQVRLGDLLGVLRALEVATRPMVSGDTPLATRLGSLRHRRRTRRRP